MRFEHEDTKGPVLRAFVVKGQDHSARPHKKLARPRTENSRKTPPGPPLARGGAGGRDARPPGKARPPTQHSAPRPQHSALSTQHSALSTQHSDRPPVERKWIRTASDEQAVREGCYFDLAAAERVREFFRKLLVHSKGQFAKEPFELLEWEFDGVIAPIYGWKRPDGTRRFRKAYVEICKKNGKSAIASGLSIYHLVGDGEPGAEVYDAACDKDQASIVWGESANMVEASPHLSRRLEVVRSCKRIVHAATRSVLQALSKMAANKEGLNASAVIVDELHAWADRELWNTLFYAGAMRRQPLLFVITTAGFDRTSLGWEVHDYAARVLSGDIVDTRFFAYIRAAEPEQRNERGELIAGDDIEDPATWAKANPSLDVLFTREDFAADLREAKRSPSLLNSFLRYRLGIWTEQLTRWIRMECWRACSQGDPRPWWELACERLRGQKCYGGLDLGATGDLTALTLLFPRKRSAVSGQRSATENTTDNGQRTTDKRIYDALCWFWCPRMGCWRDNGVYRDLYLAWEAAGWLKMTEGNVTDYDVVRADLNALADRFGIVEVAVDRNFQGAQLCTDLADDGFEMVPFGQGFFSMSGPSKAFEEMVLEGRMDHGNHPILSWMASNVSVKSDPAGNIKPCKPVHGSPLKIDGIVTSIMALGRAELAPPPKVSVYKTRGIVRL